MLHEFEALHACETFATQVFVGHAGYGPADPLAQVGTNVPAYTFPQLSVHVLPTLVVAAHEASAVHCAVQVTSVYFMFPQLDGSPP